MERAILHSDMNCFYASVETMLNPSLRDKAIAVCGSTEERHGIVLAKSEKAKKAGVKTGMANWEARACCPELITVPPQYDQYLKYSRLARGIYERYTDLVEPFGMDECWLDVTGSQKIFGSPMEIAEQIRSSIKEELGLTVSIGVSFNKIFAKLGSDYKKPDAITEIPRDGWQEIVWPLAAQELIYCGKATSAKLAKYGIRTIGDLANMDRQFIRSLLGVNGEALWTYANGRDDSRICHKEYVPPIKSVGHRLRVHGLAANGVQVFVRGDDLYGYQFQAPLSYQTQLPAEIASAAFKVFRENYCWSEKVRAVTVRAIKLTPKDESPQCSLFYDTGHHALLDDLQESIEDIRRRFGKRAITYAQLLLDLKMPDDGRDKVRMPGLMFK